MKFDVDVQVYENGRRAPEYSVNTDLNGEVSLADFLSFMKATLVITADVALKEEQEKGFDKDPVRIVDNVKGRPEALVSPLGKIDW